MTWGGVLVLVCYITASSCGLRVQISGSRSSSKWKDFPSERALQEDNNVVKSLAEFTLEEIATGQGALVAHVKRYREETDASYGWRGRRSVKYAGGKERAEDTRKLLLMRRLQRRWQRQREQNQQRNRAPVQKGVKDVQWQPSVSNQERQKQKQEQSPRQPSGQDTKGVHDKWRLINQRRRDRKSFSQRIQSRSERILQPAALYASQKAKKNTTGSSHNKKMPQEVSKFSSLGYSVTSTSSHSKSRPRFTYFNTKHNRKESFSQRNNHPRLPSFVPESTSFKPNIKPYSQPRRFGSEQILSMIPSVLHTSEKAKKKPITVMSNKTEIPQEVDKLSSLGLSVTTKPSQSQSRTHFKSFDERKNKKELVHPRNNPSPTLSSFVTESSSLKPFIKSTTALDYLSSYDSRAAPRRWPLKIILPDHDRISHSMKSVSNKRAVLPKHGASSVMSATQSSERQKEGMATPSTKSWETVMRAEINSGSSEAKASVESLEGSGAHSGEVDDDKTTTTEVKFALHDNEHEVASIPKTEKGKLTTMKNTSTESAQEVKAQKKRRRLQQRMWRRYERLRKRRLRKRQKQQQGKSEDSCNTNQCTTTPKSIIAADKIMERKIPPTKSSGVAITTAKNDFLHIPRLKIIVSPTVSIVSYHPEPDKTEPKRENLESVLLQTYPPLIINANKDKEKGKLLRPNLHSAVESLSERSNNEFSTTASFHNINTTPTKPVINHSRRKGENIRTETRVTNSKAANDKLRSDSVQETVSELSTSVAVVMTTKDKDSDDKVPISASLSPKASNVKPYFVTSTQPSKNKASTKPSFSPTRRDNGTSGARPAVFKHKPILIDFGPKNKPPRLSGSKHTDPIPEKEMASITNTNNSLQEKDVLHDTDQDKKASSEASSFDDLAEENEDKKSLETATSSSLFSRTTTTTLRTTIETRTTYKTKPRPTVSSSARRWAEYVRKRRRKQKKKNKKGNKLKKHKTETKVDSRRGSMSASWSASTDPPPQVPSKVETEEPETGSEDKGPFIGYKTAYDFLSSQKGSMGIARSEARRESNEMNRFMSEGMCEIFNKHYVSTRIGGKCV